MGFYLNSTAAYTIFRDEAAKPYFVDKSMMLKELFPLVERGNNFVCVTRPRRFGKTMMADMISAFFSKAQDSSDVFDRLYIGKEEKYREHLNRYSVIHITLNKIPKKCNTYEQYIERVESKLFTDLQNAFPEVELDETDAIWDTLRTIYEADPANRFIFVLDEWDYIFHRDFVTDEDKEEYLVFLSNLLKGNPYVLMAYMTGILPISKYSSGSELNMFLEYTMVTEERYSEYFGFTETEVDALYQKYLSITDEVGISREGLRTWYNGYQTKNGERVYNPRSVVASLSNNNLGSYWTNSGPYDEIFYYIKNNVADVRNDLALLVSGIAVPAQVKEYAATSMNLTTKDEIFSAMVVYGFLSYDKGKISIPNKELMDKFSDMLRKESSLGYVWRLAKESERMLQATLHGDTGTMMEILQYAHDTEVPLLNYNNEVELTAIVNLVYLSARNSYRIEREDKAGIGYVDFIFYPESDRTADCIILELKVDHSPEAAIQQIKDKKYALKFEGKLGDVPKYMGRILAVGISYDKESKKHSCIVEELPRT